MTISNTSRLALGTVQFGLKYGINNRAGKTSENEVYAILKTAAAVGIDTIDTASGYGDSEEVLGEYKAGEFKIVSKFSPFVITAEDLTVAFETSLQHLKTRSLYGYMAHDADLLLKIPQMWGWLQKLKDKQLVEKIGYSLYFPAQLEKLLELNFVPDIIQVPFNFIDRRFEKYFEQLKSMGCEIHIRSAFLQGLFFSDPATLPAFFNPIKPLLVKIRERFPQDAQVASFLMKYVLTVPFVDKLVFGVDTNEQLVKNIKDLEEDTKGIMIDWESGIPEEILLPYKWPK